MITIYGTYFSLSLSFSFFLSLPASLFTYFFLISISFNTRGCRRRRRPKNFELFTEIPADAIANPRALPRFAASTPRCRRVSVFSSLRVCALVHSPRCPMSIISEVEPRREAETFRSRAPFIGNKIPRARDAKAQRTFVRVVPLHAPA